MFAEVEYQHAYYRKVKFFTFLREKVERQRSLLLFLSRATYLLSF